MQADPPDGPTPVFPELSADLRSRLVLDQAEFLDHMIGYAALLRARPTPEHAVRRALGYPWRRPERSFLLGPSGEVGDLPVGLDLADRRPLVAIGSNGAPSVLRLKFEHFEEPADRTVPVVAGALHDVDVGAAAQPTVTYASMPATPFASPGTAVRVGVLWVTPAQFEQLTWSEVSYGLGHLAARFEADDPAWSLDGVLLFASRFGTFAPASVAGPVALAAVPAAGRVAPAWTQEALLDAAAMLVVGPEARAADLVQIVHEDPERVLSDGAGVRALGRPFASAAWTPYA